MARDKSTLPEYVVGIGASAGGLAALQQLLPNLPTRAGFAYIAIQHMAPTHASALDQILGKLSDLKVLEAIDGETLEAEHLYIAPADKDITVVNGAIHLQHNNTIGPRHSIDQLFTSLAQAYKDHSAGIILSGTGSDGLQGAHELKAREGFVLVQEPEEAQYDGMPSATISAHLADFVGPASVLGSELPDILTRPKGSRVNEITANQTDRQLLLTTLGQITGFPIEQYKDSTLNRRIDRRMTVNKVDSLSEYTELVRNSHEEADRLLQDMQISVTGFFRDTDTFDTIKEAIKDLIAHKRLAEPIRIWVPGCATGEEAFSIAILVAQTLGDRFSKGNVQIFATDIDHRAITHARKSVYLANQLSAMPAHLIEEYFDIVDGTRQVKSAIRDAVVFAEHDLLQDPPFGRLDLISCRNVLIYFKKPTQEKLIKAFHYGLNPGGYLALGPSEGLGILQELFEPVDTGAKVYRRKELVQPPPIMALKKRRSHASPAPQGTQNSLSLEDHIQQVLFTQCAPPTMLVNKQFNVVYLHGELAPFTQLPQGDITLNAIDLAIPQLRLELRLLIEKAQRTLATLQSHPIVITVADTDMMIRMRAIPMMHDNEAMTLVLFESEPLQHPAPENISETALKDIRVRELAQELQATRDHLQTNIEALEVANEELLSVNEEFQSASEELQSANEELQTSNEELQSTNEELHTVNEELNSKSIELEKANADLENILNNVVEGIVVLDAENRVTHYSNGAKQVFDLLPTSIGRPLNTAGESIDLSLLTSEIQAASRSKHTVERELELGKTAYLVRMTPQDSGGLIISFTDETDRILASRQAQRLAAIVRDSLDAITVQDLKGNVLAWNRGAERLYGYSEAQALTMNVDQLMDADEQKIYRSVRQRILNGEVIEPYETTRVGKQGQTLDLWVTVTALHDEQGVVFAVATTERDLRERKQILAAQHGARFAEQQALRARFERLTPREEEIFRLLVAGSGNTSSRKIGSTLGISARTVDTHRHRIKEKLGAHSMMDLLQISQTLGI